MTFQQLLDGVEVLAQAGDAAVSGVEYDSRRVQPGCLFVAMQGESSDGNAFISTAVAAGTVAVVSDSPAFVPPPQRRPVEPPRHSRSRRTSFASASGPVIHTYVGYPDSKSAV